MRKALKRVAVPNAVKNKMGVKTFPAPVRGLILNENLATAGPAAARQLDNWVPTSTGMRVRGGSKQVARVATGAPCVSLISYQTATNEKLFGCTTAAIYDITNPVDPDVAPAAAVSGQNAGYYSYVQFATAGGNYLIAVNGEDLHLTYDGTTWATNTPAITGTTSDNFSHVWTFKNRLFFVKRGTNVACYLPVDSIGGAINEISMDGIFKRGGYLLFGATWSLDSGDGLDDKCVFISSTGEMVAFEGSDPSSASTWSMIGRYDITAPMGMNAVMQAGGDLLVATQDGVVPASQAINKDSAALSLAAVSAAIEPYWKDQVVARAGLPWEILKWPSNNMMIVSQPVAFEGQDENCLVCNLETGAWSRFTGWNTRCLGFHRNYGYFGTNTGEVYQMEVGGKDGTLPYTAVYVGQFDHMGQPGATKTVYQARASFVARSPFNAKVSASTNYSVKLPNDPNSIADYVTDEWDVGLWDVAVWDSETNASYSSKWVSVGQTGYSFAPQIQMTFGITPFPRVEMVSLDMTYAGGGIVV
jgi:hypothetical protein